MSENTVITTISFKESGAFLKFILVIKEFFNKIII